MGGFFGDIGKAISKGAKSVGKFLEKAAPILLPIAASIAIPGSGIFGAAGGGGALGSIFGNSALGKVGSALLPALLTNAIAGKQKDPTEEAERLMSKYSGPQMDRFNQTSDAIMPLALANANPKPITAERASNGTGITMGTPGTGRPGDLAAPVAPRPLPIDPQMEEERRRRYMTPWRPT
jgi:hypothetical protein